MLRHHFTRRPAARSRRFHQTLKKWLRKRRFAETLEQLQYQLDEWVDHYNHHRPHRSLKDARPADIWAATPRAKPAAHPITVTTTTRRDIRTGNTGSVRVGTHTVGLGRRYAKQLVTIIATGNDCAVFLNGHCIRQLTIDPTIGHQRTPAQPTTPTASTCHNDHVSAMSRDTPSAMSRRQHTALVGHRRIGPARVRCGGHERRRSRHRPGKSSKRG